MFIVVVEFPIDEEWEARDERVRSIVGYKGFSSETTRVERTVSFLIEDFEDAENVLRALNKIPKVIARLREK